MTRETVFFETFASRAMSLIVTLALSRAWCRRADASLLVLSHSVLVLSTQVPGALALLSRAAGERGAIVARSQSSGSNARRVGGTRG